MTERKPSAGRRRTLMESVVSISCSDAEKDRIGRALANDQSLQTRILTSKAPTIRDPEFWGWRQRQFTVNGFRPGSSDAIQRVIARALTAARAHANGERHADWNRIWRLYERCVLIHVEDDLPALADLLKKEEFHSDSGSLTDQIFRDVAKSLPVYDATVEQARELYDLWWFERAENFEGTLSSASLSADAIRRLVDREVKGLQSDVKSSIASTRADMSRNIEQHALSITSVRSELADLRNRISGQVEHAKPNTTAAKSTGMVAKTEAVELTKNEGRSVSQSASREAQHALEIASPLQARVESLGKQLKELRNRLDDLHLTDAHAASAKTSGSAHLSPANVEQVIARWRDSLSRAGMPSSACAATILLEMVRRSRIILTDKPSRHRHCGSVRLIGGRGSCSLVKVRQPPVSSLSRSSMSACRRLISFLPWSPGCPEPPRVVPVVWCLFRRILI
jgi:hypothetical protein